MFRSDFEERIDSRLDWPLVQKISAKRVNRPYTREFQLLKRLVQPVTFLARLMTLLFRSHCAGEASFRPPPSQ
jgi:hypothetical protein